MSKKIISLAVVIVMLFAVSVSAFAAPEYMYASDFTDTSDLFYLKNPSYTYVTSINSYYQISGSAPEGTLITLYKYNSYFGVYRKVYMYGSPLEKTVGKMGLYAQSVNLSEGENRFMVRAEANGQVQLVRFTINLSYFDVFKVF